VAHNILILGASYGSLLATKLAMAGHDVTLVCRTATADLINTSGTEVRIKLKDEDIHRRICSTILPGRISAATPSSVTPADYDLVALAMQEPQYSAPEIRALMSEIAEAKIPCLSIMNMPPLSYLRRIPGLQAKPLASAYKDAEIWDMFEPGLMSLCSPDPQAFRPPEEAANILHVGLPTNFKAAKFQDPEHNEMLEQLAADIDAVTLDGKDVPVKLRVYDSLFVPLAKWSMLLTGNYRCITENGVRSIRDAVVGDVDQAKSVYSCVSDMVQRLGGETADQVPFEKYAAAAKFLLKPSSAARAIDSGSVEIERVDRLVQAIGKQLGMNHPVIDSTVQIVENRLAANRTRADQKVLERAAI
jgi:hypothetical protein